MTTKTVLVVAFLAAFAFALVAGEPSGWGGYFQYANVPGWGQYEFGYNRGNHDHFTSRFEQGWGWKYKTKVRWGDKKGGYGEMYYDYQHSPKKGWSHGHHGKHGGGGGGGGGGVGNAVGSFSENIPTVLKPHHNHHNHHNSHLAPLASNPQPIIGLPPAPRIARMGRLYQQQQLALLQQQQQQQPQQYPPMFIPLRSSNNYPPPPY